MSDDNVDRLRDRDGSGSRAEQLREQERRADELDVDADEVAVSDTLDRGVDARPTRAAREQIRDDIRRERRQERAEEVRREAAEDSDRFDEDDFVTRVEDDEIVVELSDEARRRQAADDLSDSSEFVDDVGPDDVEFVDDKVRFDEEVRREAAAAELAAESEFLDDLGPDDVVVDDDSVSLSEDARRESAARQFAADSEFIDDLDPSDVVVDGDEVELRESVRREMAAEQFASESDLLDEVSPDEVEIDDGEAQLADSAQERAAERSRQEVVDEFLEDQTDRFSVETAQEALFADIVSTEQFEQFRNAQRGRDEEQDPTLFESEQQIEQAVDEGVVDEQDVPELVFDESQRFSGDQTERFDIETAQEALFADIVSTEQFEQFRNAQRGRGEEQDPTLFESEQQIEQAVDEGVVDESEADDLLENREIEDIDVRDSFEFDDGEVSFTDDVQRRALQRSVDRDTETNVGLGDIVETDDGFGLSDDASIREAQQVIDDETETDIGRDDIVETDDGFGLSEVAEREEARFLIDEETDFDVGTDDIEQTDDGFGLRDDVVRDVVFEDIQDALDPVETDVDVAGDLRSAPPEVRDIAREQAADEFDDRIGDLDITADDVELTDDGARLDNIRLDVDGVTDQDGGFDVWAETAAEALDERIEERDITADDIVSVGKDRAELDESVFDDDAETGIDITADGDARSEIRRSGAEELDSQLGTLDIGVSDVALRDDGTVGLTDSTADMLSVERDDIVVGDGEDSETGLTDEAEEAFARAQLENIGSQLSDPRDVFFPAAGTTAATEVGLAAREQLSSGAIEDREAIGMASGEPQALGSGTVEFIENLDPEEAAEQIEGIDAETARQAQEELEAQQELSPSELLDDVADADGFGEQAEFITQGRLIGRGKRTQARQQADRIEQEIGQGSDLDSGDVDADVDPATGDVDIGLTDPGRESLQEDISGGNDAIRPDDVDVGFDDGELRADIDEEAVESRQIERFRQEQASEFGVDESDIVIDRDGDEIAAGLSEDAIERRQAQQDIDQLMNFAPVEQSASAQTELDRQLATNFGLPQVEQTQPNERDGPLGSIRQPLDDLSDEIRPRARDVGSTLGEAVSTPSLASPIESGFRSVSGIGGEPVADDAIEAGVEEATVTAADLPGFASDTLGFAETAAEIRSERFTAVSPFAGPGLGVTIPDPELAEEQAESDEVVFTDTEQDLIESGGQSLADIERSFAADPVDTTARAIGAIAGGAVAGIGLSRGARAVSRSTPDLDVDLDVGGFSGSQRSIDLDVDDFIYDTRAQQQLGRGLRDTDVDVETGGGSGSSADLDDLLDGVDSVSPQPDDIADQRLISSIDPRRSASEVGSDRAMQRNIEADTPDRSFSAAPDADDIESVSRDRDVRSVDQSPDTGPTSPIADDGRSFRGLDTDLSPLESQLAAQQGQRAATTDFRQIARAERTPRTDMRATDGIDSPTAGVSRAREIGAGVAAGVAGSLRGVSGQPTDSFTGSPTLTGDSTPITGQTLFEAGREDITTRTGVAATPLSDSGSDELLDTDTAVGTELDLDLGLTGDGFGAGIDDGLAQEPDADVGIGSDLGSRPATRSGVGSDIRSDVAAGLDGAVMSDEDWVAGQTGDTTTRLTGQTTTPTTQQTTTTATTTATGTPTVSRPFASARITRTTRPPRAPRPRADDSDSGDAERDPFAFDDELFDSGIADADDILDDSEFRI